ncbi:DUF4489 domain-containing protein [Wukongibacter baidiensis]|uniref:DUF4489 domain-containing protein n=1 Tax=Wukongibacter baidiensis TaxID=1723361 RepID=UPI003D7F1D60
MGGYIKKSSYYDKKDSDIKVPCDCGKEIDCAKCEPLSPCPKKILVECGTIGGRMMLTTLGQTFDMANVTVDTSCFCKPTTEIQFSSQVSAVLEPNAGDDGGLIAEITLLYELICRRNGGGDITIGSWMFRRFLSEGFQDLETTDTFSFSKCVCPEPCQGCTSYFVRVTVISLNESTEVTNTATVSNGQLVAKIQEC